MRMGSCLWPPRCLLPTQNGHHHRSEVQPARLVAVGQRERQRDGAGTVACSAEHLICSACKRFENLFERMKLVWWFTH